MLRKGPMKKLEKIARIQKPRGRGSPNSFLAARRKNSGRCRENFFTVMRGRAIATISFSDLLQKLKKIQKDKRRGRGVSRFSDGKKTIKIGGSLSSKKEG